MDEFKPDDELKPDASDRRPARPRKAPVSQAPVSRQHIMMGVGILVLLLLVLGIGSVLKGPEEKAPAHNASGGSPGGERNIDLSSSTSMAGQQQSSTPEGGNTQPAQNSPAGSGRDVSMPPISSTPTQASGVETPAGQQRVTVPGDLNSALSNQQGDINSAVQGAQQQSSLPTAPAAISENSKTAAPAPASRDDQQPAQRQADRQPTQPVKSAAKPPPAKATEPARPASSSAAKAGGKYTLQLSSASRSDTLEAWAKQQNLSGYNVYKTTRNGEPWYVLVSGSYATPADAKRALAAMPAAVRAKNPWVKPVTQVRKESGH